METSIDKSPFLLDESKKISHCIEIYSLLNSLKIKLGYEYKYNYNDIQTYAKLFDTYYTHCEYKTKTQTLKENK
jgi:hypothetical protein